MTDPFALAALARLSLTDEEVALFGSQLSSVLEYVSKIQEIDTTGVAELAYGVEGKNVWRADEVHEREEKERVDIVAQFPRQQNNLLEVPAVFESRTE